MTNKIKTAIKRTFWTLLCAGTIYIGKELESSNEEYINRITPIEKQYIVATENTMQANEQYKKAGLEWYNSWIDPNGETPAGKDSDIKGVNRKVNGLEEMAHNYFKPYIDKLNAAKSAQTSLDTCAALKTIREDKKNLEEGKLYANIITYLGLLALGRTTTRYWKLDQES